MKMVCPHCGVKGSASEKLIGTKVKCPKCFGIFEVVAEVVQPIAMEEIELEPVASPADDLHGMSSEQEVDDVFNDLLGRTDSTGEPSDNSELEMLLRGDEQASDDESVIAALADMPESEDESANEWLGEQEDETLTVIEDFPEEALVEKAVAGQPDESDELSLDDDDLLDDQLEKALAEGGNDAQVEDRMTLEDDEEQTTELAEQREVPADEIEPEAEEEILGFDEEVAAELSEADDIFTDEVDRISPEGQEPADIFTDFGEEEAEIPPETDATGEADIFAEPDNDQQDTLDYDDEEAPEEIDLEEAEDEFADDTDIEVVDVSAAEEEAEEGEVEVDEGVIVQKCAACHEYVDPDLYYGHQGNVYCSKCIPPGAVRYEKQDLSVVEEKTARGEQADTKTAGDKDDKSRLKASDAEIAAAAATVAAAAAAADSAAEMPGRFTVSTLIKDAYHYAKGAKGSIWGAAIVMFLIIVGVAAATTYFLPAGTDEFASLPALLLNAASQIGMSFIASILSAGILLIGVHKVGQLNYSWKMVFRGFSRFGSMLGLFILYNIMLTVGFLLFILPGIYLSVGYILAIPLIFMRNYSPWQALEESRKAIHERWWTVFFALIAMGILTVVSAIPAGIGLIWTIPMFVVLVAVLYYHFFGAEE